MRRHRLHGRFRSHRAFAFLQCRQARDTRCTEVTFAGTSAPCSASPAADSAPPLLPLLLLLRTSAGSLAAGGCTGDRTATGVGDDEDADEASELTAADMPGGGGEASSEERGGGEDEVEDEDEEDEEVKKTTGGGGGGSTVPADGEDDDDDDVGDDDEEYEDEVEEEAGEAEADTEDGAVLDSSSTTCTSALPLTLAAGSIPADACRAVQSLCCPHLSLYTCATLPPP